MSEAPIDLQALHVLAQYRPFEDGSAGMQAAHDDLVAAACHANGGGFENLEACRQYLASTFSIELEIDEIRDARDRLVAAGSARRAGGGIELAAETRIELDHERETWESAEATALEEWERAVPRSFPLMSEGHLAQLRDQVRPWLDRVIATHGAEAGLLVYPSHPRANALVEAITKIDLSFLPPCDAELEPHRASAFRLLVRDPTIAQREFLGRLLNTGFYLTVLTLDPRAEQLVKAETSKITLYLDTNFLYSVLGVSSATEAFGAKRFLELCKSLGISLRISPWTADELRTSIASSQQSVERFAKSRKTAAVMAQVSGEKGFTAAYWRAARDNNETPSDFFGKFGYFSRFLEQHGIEEHPEGVPEIEAQVERLRLYSSPLEGMYGPGARPRVVIEHDAKMRMLIEHLRSQTRPPAGYSEVRYWFVTESTRLPTYARVPVEGFRRPKYPFCILSSTWAQLLRAMVPRTADLNDMVVELLASPYVGYRSALSGPARMRALERVTGRIESMRHVPPAVAVAVANDRAMATKIGEETDEATVDALIDEALTLKAQELEEQVSTAAERIAQAEQEREEAKAEAAEAASAASAAEMERKRAEGASVATRDELAAAAAAHTSVEAKLRGERDDAKLRADREKQQRQKTQRRQRAALAAVAVVLVNAAAIAVLLTGVISATVPVIAVVSAAVGISYVLVRLVSPSLAKEIAVVTGVLAAVVSIAAALIGASTVDEKNTATPRASPTQTP